MEILVGKREITGSSRNRRLRRTGKVPAILYGGNSNPRLIEVEQSDLLQALSKEQLCSSSILELNIDGKVESTLLRSIQWHPYKPIILHVDFQRIEKEKIIHVRVPLRFVNEHISPAVRLSNVIPIHTLTEIEVACFPRDLPEYLEVDLSNLSVGDNIHLQDILLPNGVRFLSHGGDQNPLLVSATSFSSNANDDSNENKSEENVAN